MAGRPPHTPHIFTPARQAAFLLALERLGEPGAACAAAGVSYTTMATHREKWPEFADACKAALGKLDDELVSVARLLAITGIEEPVLNRHGVQTGTRRKYDARLLERWLKRRMPGEWGDKLKVDQSVEGRVQITGAIQPAAMTPRERRLARALLEGDEGLSNN